MEVFGFAPQRFAPLKWPSSWFDWFAHVVVPITKVIALEAEHPGTKERAKWARAILRELNGNTWVGIGRVVISLPIISLHLFPYRLVSFFIVASASSYAMYFCLYSLLIAFSADHLALMHAIS